MYSKIDDFIEDWKVENASTIKLLNSLTDASLAQKVAPEGRTLGYLAWHITLSMVEMGNRAGLGLKGPGLDSSEPKNVREIVEAYRDVSGQIGEKVSKLWTDSSLNEEFDMFGQMWKRKTGLISLIRHEAHHRGQMTVLMRQAGLKVPGIYGPSKEEWSAYGMPSQK